MNFWRDLSIKYKLILGLGCLGVLTLGISTWLGRELSTIEKAYQQLVDYQMTLALQSEKASALMLQCRRNEKDFLMRLDEKYIKRHGATLQKLETVLDEMEEKHNEMTFEIISSEDIKATQSAVASYREGFGKTAEAWKTKGLDHESGLRGKMRSAVHDVEDIFKRINEDNLMVSLLMLRRHEKDYMIRGLEKYPQKWSDQLAGLQADLNNVNLRSSARTTVNERLGLYESSFGELQAQDAIIKTAIADMRAAIHKTEPLLAKIQEVALTNAAEQQEAVALAVAQEHERLTFVYIVVAALFAIFALMIVRGIVGPLSQIMVSIRAIENGDLTTRPKVKGKDEIGQVAVALGTMISSVSTAFGKEQINWDVIAEQQLQERERVERERETARVLEEKVSHMEEVMEAVSHGDLSKDVSLKGEDAMGRIGGQLRQLLATLREDLSEIHTQANVIKGTSSTLDGISGDIMTQSDHNHEYIQVTNGKVDMVNANLQSVATAIEQMNACIAEIAKNAELAEGVAQTAVDEAAHSSEVIAKLERHGQEISAMTDEIGKVAEQTNLLSLNASIEAERAGESGKGFRIVAYEVKELARNTGETTDKIRRNVEGIRLSMGEAVASIDKITGIINEIFEVQRSIASAVEEQSVTTNEIQNLVTQTAQESEEIHGQMREVEANANSTKSSVNKASGEANRLADLSDSLHKTLAKFTLANS